MKKFWIVIAVFVIFVLMGCATMIPIGTLYTEQKLPMMVTSNGGSSSKIGRAQCTSIMGLIAWGDCSIAAAKKNGGIKKIYSVDWKVKNILGIYGTYDLVVTGE
jgi:hypothetical protein